MKTKDALMLISGILALATCANAQAPEGAAGIPIDEDLDELEGFPKAKMVSKTHKLFYKALVRDYENVELFPAPKEEGNAAELLNLIPGGNVLELVKKVAALAGKAL